MSVSADPIGTSPLELPGPRAAEILALEAEHLSPGVAPARDLVWERAEESVIVDVDGNRFIDLATGVLITNIGHAHPAVTTAVSAAAEQSLTFYNAAHSGRAELAARLAGLLPEGLERSLFFSGGAEAIDASIRLARLHTGREGVLSFRGAFHGRSYLPMSVSGLTRLRSGFGLGVPGVVRAEYPSGDADLDRWEEGVRAQLELDSPGPIAAILAEPYQGAGGVIVPPEGFIGRLRNLCDELGALLIIDEVQSGFGRTGSLFAFEQSGVVPDMITLGKPLANGFPMSAVVASEAVAGAIPRESLSSTFGGNPVATAAALAVIDVFERDGMLHQGVALADHFGGLLDALADSHERISEIRQWGLAIGVEVNAPDGYPGGARAFARRLVERALVNGLVMISPIGIDGNVLRIGPALNMPSDLASRSVELLDRTINEVEGEAK